MLWLVLLLGLTSPLPGQLTEDERKIARYYSWHRHSLEGADVRRNHAEKLMTLRDRTASTGRDMIVETNHMGTARTLSAWEFNQGLRLHAAIAPDGMEVGISNLNLGPLSLGTSLMTGYKQHLGEMVEELFAGYPPVRTPQAENLPINAVDVSLTVQDVGRIRARREVRRFIYYEGDPASYDRIAYDAEELVGYQFEGELYPATLVPGVPILNRLPVLSFETVTEGFEPDGYTVTSLFSFPRLWASQFLVSVGRAETTDLWFAKPLVTLGAGTLQVDADFVSDAPALRRARVGASFLHLPTLFVPEFNMLWEGMEDLYLVTDGSFLILPMFAYEYRLVDRRTTAPGGLDPVNQFGLSAFIAATVPPFDLIYETNICLLGDCYAYGRPMFSIDFTYAFE